MAQDIATISRQIAQLPEDWHGAGTVTPGVLDALARHSAARGGLTRSMETGTGRTTLLLSHLSRHHTVFTADDAQDGGSLDQVRRSPLLDGSTVHFEVGPTQRVLRDHVFDAPVQLAYLDGPHGYPFPELEYWATYPHIEPGGLLVIDDVHIPTIAHMFRFLRDDAMWELRDVVHHTAFFERTEAPLVDPWGDGWWLQGANRNFEYSHLPIGQRLVARAKEATPEPLRVALRKRLDRRAQARS